LVDEAKRAVIVASTYSVKHRGINTQTQRLTGHFGYAYLVAKGSILALQEQGHRLAVNQLLVLNNVRWLSAVYGQQLVADADIKVGNRGIRLYC
jgi:hypothetical protein